MTLDDLRQEAWNLARETATVDADRLWSESEMNLYINRVYRFIARETKSIRDSITPSVCRITVAPPTDLAALTSLAATDSWYAQDLAWYNDTGSWLYHQLVSPYSLPLSPLILRIDEAKWTINQWRLTKVSVTKWQTNPWWEQVIATMSTEYATDLDNNRIALNYRTQTSDTLKLHVRRMPLTDLSADTDVPELRLEYHDFMLNGILYWMYSKQDSQTFDAAKALDFKSKFMEDVDYIKQQDTLLDNRLRPNSSLDAFR